MALDGIDHTQIPRFTKCKVAIHRNLNMKHKTVYVSFKGIFPPRLSVVHVAASVFSFICTRYVLNVY